MQSGISTASSGGEWERLHVLKQLGIWWWKPMSSREGLSKTSDYKDLLSVFNAFRVRYLVVGGYAVMQYTEPRYTKDLDVRIDRSSPQARCVYHFSDLDNLMGRT
jgi:hypothetical protein